jgi:predicted enzyme related to lactoylglutathione lyase
VIDPTGAPISFWKSSQGDHPDVTRLPDHHFCWNELWTADEKAALAFYESVFGYTHDTMPMGAAGDYYILKTSEGRAGIMRSQPPQPTLWVPYVLVADTDALAAKAQGLGAKIVVPPADIPNMGRFAILIDPSGATIAIFKPAAR